MREPQTADDYKIVNEFKQRELEYTTKIKDLKKEREEVHKKNLAN